MNIFLISVLIVITIIFLAVIKEYKCDYDRVVGYNEEFLKTIVKLESKEKILLGKVKELEKNK